ncbi:MAG: LysM peptidoglycan-binding domain-containing protein [Balneolaceae bacterium]|nr:LysM peptidoglycan-binding domain-containing protein [Balneolaceae bacterium]
MKITDKGFTLTVILLCCAGFLFLKPDNLYSQSLTVGDPIEDYLRLFETKNDSLLLPSLTIGFFSAEDYREKLDLSNDHPWSYKFFFSKKEDQITKTASSVKDSVDTDSLKIHLVKPQQTVYRISRMYGITEEQLRKWNNLSDNEIYIDQELIVEKPKSFDESQNQTQFDVSENPKKKWSVKYYSPVAKITHNNNYPIGQNDGALWQGRGVNSMISSGAYLSYGPLKASVRPNLIYNANQGFPLSRWPAPEGISEYGYEFSVIDYPQRFGDKSITKLDLGQSWIRGDYREFSAGLSTSTTKLGPSIYNPIMLSNNSPGFLHFFIGTHEPFETKIGNIEGKIFWGRLKESGYFDENESNNFRFINGLILSYSPDFLKGLNLGISRIFVKSTTDPGLSFGDYFLALGPMKKGDGDEVKRLQMSSLFGRWKIPNYGFEFYAEWARNTPANNFRDLFLQPEYSRSYTMGFLKRFILTPNHWLTLHYEMTQIERPRSIEFRPSEPFYRSSVVAQGYTHQGQMLGAGIGPGSNSQKVHLKYYWKYGMFGASFNRIVHDNTRLYENFMVIGERPWGIRNPRIANEVEFRYGLNALVFIGSNVELQFDFYRSRFFHHEHGILPFENPDVYNTNLQFTLRYHLDNFLR